MRLTYILALMLTLAAGFGQCQDIKFPKPPTPPPTPQVIDASNVIDLYQNQTLVVESDNPFFLITGTDETSDLLIISDAEPGPQRVRGVFAPAPPNSAAVSRDYQSKYLALGIS